MKMEAERLARWAVYDAAVDHLVEAVRDRFGVSGARTTLDEAVLDFEGGEVGVQAGDFRSLMAVAHTAWREYYAFDVPEDGDAAALYTLKQAAERADRAVLAHHAAAISRAALTVPAELKVLSAAATRGPWQTHLCNSGEECWCRTVSGPGNSEDLDNAVACAGDLNKANAEFIAATANFVRSLIAAEVAP